MERGAVRPICKAALQIGRTAPLSIHTSSVREDVFYHLLIPYCVTCSHLMSEKWYLGVAHVSRLFSRLGIICYLGWQLCFSLYTSFASGSPGWLLLVCALVLCCSFSAAAKSLQSCPTLCDPIDSSPPGSPIPGILQARTLEWVAISFSSA